MEPFRIDVNTGGKVSNARNAVAPQKPFPKYYSVDTGLISSGWCPPNLSLDEWDPVKAGMGSFAQTAREDREARKAAKAGGSADVQPTQPEDDVPTSGNGGDQDAAWADVNGNGDQTPAWDDVNGGASGAGW